MARMVAVFFCLLLSQVAGEARLTADTQLLAVDRPQAAKSANMMAHRSSFAEVCLGSFTALGGGHSWQTLMDVNELAPLTTSGAWTLNSEWTMTATVSSAATMAATFGFSGGGGYHLVTVAPGASSQPISVTDIVKYVDTGIAQGWGYKLRGTWLNGDITFADVCFHTPSAAPTPSPTPPPGSGGASSPQAVGDPHLTNLYGQRFDVMRPGIHLLAQVPRHAEPSSSLLEIRADVQRLGAQCADMYIQTVNVTGGWVPHNHLTYTVHKVPRPAYWQELNKVSLKVVQGRTTTGVAYLNVMLRNLGRVPYLVGGLLGLDDHTEVSTPEKGCRQQTTL